MRLTNIFCKLTQSALSTPKNWSLRELAAVVKFTLAVSFVFLSIGAEAEVNLIDRVVAVVGNSVVTQAEWDASARRALRVMRAGGSGFSGNDLKLFRNEVLHQLIARKLQLQEASKFGIVIDNATVDKAMDGLAAREGLSLNDYRRKIESESEDYSWMRKQIRDDIAINTVRQREVIDRIRVKEREVQELLLEEVGDDAPEIFMVLARFEASSLREDAPRRLRQLISRLRRENINTLSWLRQRIAVLTRKLNICDGCANYKVFRWAHFHVLPEAVRDSFNDVRPGSVGSLLITKDTYLFYQLLGVSGISSAQDDARRLYKARHILLKTDPMRDEVAVKKRLLELKKRIQKGEKFSDLAKQFSEDPLSAIKNGDLGWLAADRTVLEFAERLTAAKLNTIVGPFETTYGWHLLEVQETRKAKSDTDEMYKKAVDFIRRGKANAEIQRWLSHLRDTSVVRIIADN